MPYILKNLVFIVNTIQPPPCIPNFTIECYVAKIYETSKHWVHYLGLFAYKYVGKLGGDQATT